MASLGLESVSVVKQGGGIAGKGVPVADRVQLLAEVMVPFLPSTVLLRVVFE